MIEYDTTKPYGGLVQGLSCPPTVPELRAHYERCLASCEAEANKKIFRDLLAKLEEQPQ
jgi:hypothetical protein